MAKQAKTLFDTLNCHSLEEHKALLQSNGMANNPVASEHVKCMQGIHGNDVGKLKGVSTRRKPQEVIEDHVDIQKQLTSME